MAAAKKSKRRQALEKQARQIYRDGEGEFASVLASAAKMLPKESTSDTFPFVIRMLWKDHSGSLPPNWWEKLPQQYADYIESRKWLLQDTTVKGDLSDDGIEAISRLLITLRTKQRWKEGK